METILAAILGFFAYPVVIGIICLILSIAYTVATEADEHGFAIFVTIVAALIYCKWIIGLFAFWQFLLLGAGLYALLGGAYSVYRWFRYCRQYIEDHPWEDVSEHDKYDYIGGVKTLLTPTAYYQDKLRPGDHKSKLIGWIAYWPWSLIWNVVGDTLTTIYDALANIYQRTANAVIRKALGNFGNYSNKTNKT